MEVGKAMFDGSDRTTGVPAIVLRHFARADGRLLVGQGIFREDGTLVRRLEHYDIYSDGAERADV